jgi:acetate kinase
VLVVNAGSSSLKLRVVDHEDAVIAGHDAEAWDGAPSSGGVAEFVGALGGVDAVGHRVVHGGTRFTAPVVIDPDVRAAFDELTALAPLHQPRSLAAVDAVGSLLPDTTAVACFDTAFHHTLTAAAATYAVPEQWRAWGVRRFGFHGLSHAYAARRGAALAGRSLEGTKIVSCHLGAGASLCAVSDGRSVDTTMGFTPLEGLVMATRSGTVDPGLVLWLQETRGLGAAEVSDGLEHRGGVAALAGGDGDLRDVVARAAGGDDGAVAAIAVYVHRLVREIGAMVAVLGGLDVLVFTGGVGEHQPPLRAATVDRLAFLGLELDRVANERTAADADVSAAGAAVRTVVVTAREDLEIAARVRSVL